MVKLGVTSYKVSKTPLFIQSIKSIFSTKLSTSATLWRKRGLALHPRKPKKPCLKLLFPLAYMPQLLCFCSSLSLSSVILPATISSQSLSGCTTMGQPCCPPAPPPYTSVPDYVWADVRDCSLQFARMLRKRREERREGQEEEEVHQVLHPNAEAALRAAKRACRGREGREGRWFGRAASCEAGGTVFLVYKDGKVIERHVACR